MNKDLSNYFDLRELVKDCGVLRSLDFSDIWTNLLVCSSVSIPMTG